MQNDQEMQNERGVQFYLTAVGLTAIGVCGPLINVFFGALGATISGWFFGATLIGLFATIGIEGFALWQIGVFLTLVGGFFVSNLSMVKLIQEEATWQKALSVTAKTAGTNLIVLPILGCLIGAWTGWIVGLAVSEPMLGLFAAIGIKGFALWQITAWLGFVGAYFKWVNLD